jgi:RNA recognition motif-containing protein
MGSKLFVGNLAYDTTSEDLRALFAEVGTCESATVVTDRDTGRSRGFGFVEMASAADAEKAVQSINGREFQGRELKVDTAHDRPARERRGGGGGGGGRRY